VYFADYSNGTPGRIEHVKDERDMLRAIDDRALPAVSIYKPIGRTNEHPGYADAMHGDRNAAMIIRSIQNSFIWDDAVIIVTYAENGGLWDHVAPPKLDRCGTVGRKLLMPARPVGANRCGDSNHRDRVALSRTGC
jgi:phospholipase C